jgi:hypothetical protein
MNKDVLVDGNNFISHYLKNNIPLAAGKIGVTELNLLYCHNKIVNSGIFLSYLQHEVENIAGLYPYTKEITIQFGDEMLNKLQTVDLIPKWSVQNPLFENYIFKNYCSKASITTLQHLEPYFFDKPWTNYLAGKKVLVVSPFADSIENNFANLSKIWNGKIQNNFTLKTLKYPFAIKISHNTKYKVSDEIYQEYKQLISNEDFDIAIIGTGYTSLLLTCFIKQMGKSAIHLGGATQILFGVKGNRWREMKEFQPFFNDHWTEPLDHEKPEKRHLTEGGCYW